MITVKHLRWSVLQKAREGREGVELGPFDKGTSTPEPFFPKSGHLFDFQKEQGRPSLSSLVQHMKGWLNFHQYPWIFRNILENIWINNADYAKALNMYDNLIC